MSAASSTSLGPGPETTIAPLTPEHWPAVERIYRAGIATGHATFESEPPTWEAFQGGKLDRHRWVALDPDGSVLGWVAASGVSDRCVYAGVVEHSVYVDEKARGKGVGSALLDAFVKSADGVGIWMIQSSIFPENIASLRLHERAGFRVVGRRERIARSRLGPNGGQWRDTVLIERRSAVNGLD